MGFCPKRICLRCTGKGRVHVKPGIIGPARVGAGEQISLISGSGLALNAEGCEFVPLDLLMCGLGQVMLCFPNPIGFGPQCSVHSPH
jgi:hypothetical protein